VLRYRSARSKPKNPLPSKKRMGVQGEAAKKLKGIFGYCEVVNK